MDDSFRDIFREWKDRVADPAIYEHIDSLFPEFGFVRRQMGSRDDHWASRYKINLSLPKHRNAEKTVIYRSELRFREQGEWENYVNLIDRYMADHGIGHFYDAYKDLSDRLGLEMPERDGKEAAKRQTALERRRALGELLIDYFKWNLLNGHTDKAIETRRYIQETRRFTIEEAMRVNLGVSPKWDSVVHYISSKGFSMQELKGVCDVLNDGGRTGVGSSHTLAIPYVCGGDIKGFIFRRVGESGRGPKYIASADLDRKSAFFNIPKRVEDGRIVIVEGEMDALRATASGVPGVVAIGGSEVTGERRRQIEDALRRGVKRITICLDLDTTGESEEPNIEARHQHVMRTLHTIKDVDPLFENIFVAAFAYPTDPDEFIRERGVEAFKSLIDGADFYWEYLYHYNMGDTFEDVR